MHAGPWLRYVRNCFWLLVPVLVFNVVLAGALPKAFQPDVFWSNIPLLISVPENILRVMVFFVPALMPLGQSERRSRTAGLLLYGLGLGVYFASWAILILWPDSRWSATAVGFMAPAWTPVFWLSGIAVLGGRNLFVPMQFYRPWMFVLLCGLFLVFHNAHAALVLTRL